MGIRRCCCECPDCLDSSCLEFERMVNNPEFDVENFPRITQSETSIGRFGDFILYGFNDSNESNLNRFSGFAFSNNLGLTWTDGGSLPVNLNGANLGDPVIAVDRNGVFYYGQIGIEVVNGNRQGVISVSTGTITPQGTINMNLPQVVGRGQNIINGFSQDKEWITVGPDAARPGQEALYITWTDFSVNPQTIRFSKYETGVNLNPLITDQVIVPGGDIQSSFPVVDAAGNIYVFYFETTGFDVLGQPNRTIRMVKSTNGGGLFSNSVAITAPFAAAATNVDLCQRPSIGFGDTRRIRTGEDPAAAIGPDGTLYVVWNQGSVVNGTTIIDVMLAYSIDQGNTWTTVNMTSDKDTFAIFPSVAVNQNGAHVQYNRFNDQGGTLQGIGDGTFAIFVRSFSIAGGIREEKMVSTEFSPIPVTNPNPGNDVGRCYMGDYNQIITGPGNCLLHSWGDNRNEITVNNITRINPDVFFSRTISCSNE